MLDQSLNLVDMIRSHLSGDNINTLSSVLGEGTDRTRLGIAAAIPALLSALDRTAATSDGVRLVNSQINNVDDSILNNVRSTLGRGLMSDSGSGMLRSIIGAGEISELKNFVGRASGLSGRTVASMLGLLAPIIFSVLKRVKETIGSESFDVAGLLASQRANIAAAMPEGAGEVYTGPRPAPRDTRTSTERTHGERRWPWATLALLIGGLFLLWHWLGRPSERAFVPPSTVHAGGDQTTRPGTMSSLQRLIMKYESVMRVARAQGVQISDFREENGKLAIRGTAPSLEAANKVWSEIKRINPTLDDITADFKVVSLTPTAPSDKEQSATEPLRQKSSEAGQMYTVQRGDTLTSISKHFYGAKGDYKRILDANHEKIANENLIHVGQELSIP